MSGRLRQGGRERKSFSEQTLVGGVENNVLVNAGTSVVDRQEIFLAGELSTIGMMTPAGSSSQLCRTRSCCLSCGQGMFVITPGTAMVSAQP
jgi:hypothetical protein